MSELEISIFVAGFCRRGNESGIKVGREGSIQDLVGWVGLSRLCRSSEVRAGILNGDLLASRRRAEDWNSAIGVVNSD